MAFADASPRIMFRTVEAGQVVVAEDVQAGDAVTYNAGWKRAGAATATPVFFAKAAAQAGETVTICSAAEIWDVSGATPGAAIMLADGGGFQEAASGQQVGVALTPTSIWVGLTNPVTVA